MKPLLLYRYHLNKAWLYKIIWKAQHIYRLHLFTSETDKPILSSSSASSSRAPANTRTKLVPSPTSCSCIWDASTIILAAGCCTCITNDIHVNSYKNSADLQQPAQKHPLTSSSLRIVAASLVTNSFSKWLMTILFIPGKKHMHLMGDESTSTTYYSVSIRSLPLGP